MANKMLRHRGDGRSGMIGQDKREPALEGLEANVAILDGESSCSYVGLHISSMQHETEYKTKKITHVRRGLPLKAHPTGGRR